MHHGRQAALLLPLLFCCPTSDCCYNQVGKWHSQLLAVPCHPAAARRRTGGPTRRCRLSWRRSERTWHLLGSRCASPHDALRYCQWGARRWLSCYHEHLTFSYL